MSLKGNFSRPLSSVLLVEDAVEQVTSLSRFQPKAFYMHNFLINEWIFGKKNSVGSTLKI